MLSGIYTNHFVINKYTLEQEDEWRKEIDRICMGAENHEQGVALYFSSIGSYYFKATDTNTPEMVIFACNFLAERNSRKEGETVATYAVKHNNVAVIHYLIHLEIENNMGAGFFKLENDKGQTPYGLARELGHVDIQKALIDYDPELIADDLDPGLPDPNELNENFFSFLKFPEIGRLIPEIRDLDNQSDDGANSASEIMSDCFDLSVDLFSSSMASVTHAFDHLRLDNDDGSAPSNVRARAGSTLSSKVGISPLRRQSF